MMKILQTLIISIKISIKCEIFSQDVTQNQYKISEGECVNFLPIDDDNPSLSSQTCETSDEYCFTLNDINSSIGGCIDQPLIVYSDATCSDEVQFEVCGEDWCNKSSSHNNNLGHNPGGNFIKEEDMTSNQLIIELLMVVICLMTCVMMVCCFIFLFCASRKTRKQVFSSSSSETKKKNKKTKTTIHISI